MASINSIYGSSTNKGVGGLLSGLDTDDLVEKMTLATRTKINRQYQSKQKLLYRQEAYREITSKLKAFSDKYFSYSSGSKTNIMSASFFEAYTYKSSSSYVNISGNAENIRNFSIEKITSVASEASATVDSGIASADMNKTLNELGITDNEIYINDKKIEVDGTKSVNDLMKKINSESDVNITYSSTLNKFIVKSKETGLSAEVKITGDSSDQTNGITTALFGGVVSAANGTDTIIDVSIYGQPVIGFTSSSASFTIDGMTISLDKKAKDLENITFEVANNVDEVVERVKKFIDDYNEIINLVGTKTKERPNSKYPPLTPDQEDEMEDKEIANWLVEAKKGVLFGDKKMGSLLSDMRTSMMGKTDVSSLMLANIGISPAFMDTSGKLVLDEDKFKEMLIKNPDEVASLFSGSSEDGKSGLAIQFKEVLTRNIGALGTSGILIDEAGTDGSVSVDQNNISKKIKDYDDKMEALKKTLEKERQRYWNQFTALEKTLSELNAQSSWLTDMMG